MTVRKLNSTFHFGALIATIKSHVEPQMSYLRCFSVRNTFASPTNTHDLPGCPCLAWDAEVTKKTLYPPQPTCHLGSSPPLVLWWLLRCNLLTFHFLETLSQRHECHQNTHQRFQRGRKLIDCIPLTILLFFLSIALPFLTWVTSHCSLHPLMAHLLTNSSQPPPYYISMLVSPQKKK